MGLTSEQASAMAARPRIHPVQEDQMVSMFAEGQSVKEVALCFPDFAQATIANLKTRKKEQIAELRRKRTSSRTCSSSASRPGWMTCRTRGTPQTC
jgi:hypothetical protein